MKKKLGRMNVLTALLMCFAFQAWAADYYVAKTGKDTNAGTAASPWLTVQKAANTATAGSTVNIMAGTYNERVSINVSGSASLGYITFQNYGTDVVLLDGTGLSVSGATPMLSINSKSYIRVKGLQICNLKTSTKGSLPEGISISGTAGYIDILNNYIHHIANTTAISSGGSGRDAHGLAVYGTSGTTPISNLIIDGNEIAFCTLGSSESLVLNGNVSIFQVSNNVIHDNDNIGIDLAGFWGVAPSNDQARNGLVQGNTVYNITSYGNPSYGTNVRAADGIYVDGGRDILIECNTVSLSDIGIEVASEQSGKTTTGVTVRNNLVYKCYYTGLAFGGYSTSVGSTANCSFTGNTLIQNDTMNSWTGDILIQKSHDNVIMNNIIYTSSQNIPVSNPFTSANAYNNTFDHNLYFTPAGATNSTWNWQNKDYASFAAYKTASGQDANSVFADPLFLNLALYDVHLKSTSPAVDGGDPTYVPAIGELDLYGDARASGACVDIGASESVGTVQPPTDNQLPAITKAAWATPSSPVAGVVATVDVGATDPDNSPSPLAYTWSKISGPTGGTVTFNISGASTASARTATFSAAGAYVLGVSVTDGAATTITSLNVTVQAATASTPGQVTSWTLPGATTTLLKPVFTWSAATNAGRYLLKVDDLTAGTAGIINVTVTTTSYTATVALTVGHNYQAVVTAQSSDGSISGAPSPALTFTVLSQVVTIGTPTWILPGATTTLVKPTFSWTAAANAGLYRLKVDDLTTGVKGVIAKSVTTTSFTATTALTAGHQYQAVVTAKNSAGTISGTPSSPLVFTVQASQVVTIGTPSWILPGATTTLVKPVFSWSAASNAGRYLLKVDDLTAGTAGIINVTVTTTKFTATTALTVDHQYQAVVTAQNSTGTVSGTPSSPLVFTVQASPVVTIGTPTGLTPTGTINDAWPWCEWTAVSGANYYVLSITDVTTGTLAGTMNVTGTGTSFNKGLTPNHSYSWTVRACTNSGTLGTWSTALAFKESSTAK